MASQVTPHSEMEFHYRTGYTRLLPFLTKD